VGRISPRVARWQPAQSLQLSLTRRPTPNSQRPGQPGYGAGGDEICPTVRMDGQVVARQRLRCNASSTADLTAPVDITKQPEARGARMPGQVRRSIVGRVY
jgi:hypothetical protein